MSDPKWTEDHEVLWRAASERLAKANLSDNRWPIHTLENPSPELRVAFLDALLRMTEVPPSDRQAVAAAEFEMEVAYEAMRFEQIRRTIRADASFRRTGSRIDATHREIVDAYIADRAEGGTGSMTRVARRMGMSVATLRRRRQEQHIVRWPPT